jgi:adenosylcobinamide amidohydrolase
MLRGDVLVLDLETAHRCASSAVLGGGMGLVRTWINAQVPPDYARLDPAEHLRDLARDLAAEAPVVGMLTAALVRDHAVKEHGSALAVATVGLGDPLSAAGDAVDAVPAVGTINVLVRVDVPLTDAALVGAVATATEAKAQALAQAGVRAANGPGLATGTPTDAVCIACPPAHSAPAEEFAGTATRVGGDLARAVRDAVLAGTERYEAWRRKNGSARKEMSA